MTSDVYWSTSTVYLSNCSSSLVTYSLPSTGLFVGSDQLGRGQEVGEPCKARSTWWRHFSVWLILSVLMISGYPAWADHDSSVEAYNTGWSFQFDNDVFANSGEDQDYTGGFAVTLSGSRAQEYRWTPERLRSWADNLIGLDYFLNKNEEHFSVHALEWGAALFTPNDISSSQANANDRPYASLFFLNSTEQSVIPARKLSIKSGLTVGFLGLSLAETVQRGVHSVLGNQIPEGWRNQISDGGEPTAKYSLSFQRAAFQRAYANGLAQEINVTGKADIGFTTGVGVGFSWRFGRINTPWWTFNPHQSEYFNLSGNVSSGQNAGPRIKERYVYAGSTLNYNVYNAFVQGQFRSSAVEVDRSDVIAESVEIWGGVSVDISENIRADVFLRSRTQDLELPESRALSWGGVILSKSF